MKDPEQHARAYALLAQFLRNLSLEQRHYIYNVDVARIPFSRTGRRYALVIYVFYTYAIHSCTFLQELLEAQDCQFDLFPVHVYEEVASDNVPLHRRHGLVQRNAVRGPYVEANACLERCELLACIIPAAAARQAQFDAEQPGYQTTYYGDGRSAMVDGAGCPVPWMALTEGYSPEYAPLAVLKRAAQKIRDAAHETGIGGAIGDISKIDRADFR